MKSNRTAILATLYTLVAIATFGHAWNRDFSKYYDADGVRLFMVPLSAALWPLYWSEVAWGHNR